MIANPPSVRATHLESILNSVEECEIVQIGTSQWGANTTHRERVSSSHVKNFLALLWFFGCVRTAFHCVHTGFHVLWVSQDHKNREGWRFLGEWCEEVTYFCRLTRVHWWCATYVCDPSVEFITFGCYFDSQFLSLGFAQTFWVDTPWGQYQSQARNYF